ncbi:uncharacterized protein FTJAE_4857 [Fusarium tjaetaba]|uniref:Uncharacterized protein n=1 Tax=Fusarium tjaetaba TaxID=1567544 RepID=A0A8H5RTD4_9HYPO|nr:uncharacterized protein FTJAE_4857 [Fusarium tjaetaba]KAF5639519.1 hypothetical protein FTJAE_4857 [Fusarium tjaetaba]
MSASKLEIPGFTTISDQIFERRVDTNSASPDSHPHMVLIFGWGDGLPKHVLRYSQGYQAMFPNATQFIILAKIVRVLSSDLPQSSAAMRPLIKAAFGPGDPDEKRILVHCMSDSGGINYAATLNEYRSQFSRPLPHQLLVLDSSPGTSQPSLFDLAKFSVALAPGFTPQTPWHTMFAQGLTAAFLASHGMLELLNGRDASPVYCNPVLNDPFFETKEASRLYLYSKADDMVRWEHVVQHETQASQCGYKASMKLFYGSKHVGHMPMYPDQYWASIAKAWKASAEQSISARL